MKVLEKVVEKVWRFFFRRKAQFEFIDENETER